MPLPRALPVERRYLLDDPDDVDEDEDDDFDETDGEGTGDDEDDEDGEDDDDEEEETWQVFGPLPSKPRAVLDFPL